MVDIVRAQGPMADNPNLHGCVEGNDDLELDLWDEVHGVFRTTVELSMAFLSAETFHLGHGDALHADFGQRFTHIVELEGLHDGFDLLHGWFSPMPQPFSLVARAGAVAVGLAVLLALPVPFIRTLGVGGMLVPAAAVLAGGNVRVGLEDNLWLEKGVLAENWQLVERAHNIIENMGARVIGPEEVRAKLGLTKRAPQR